MYLQQFNLVNSWPERSRLYAEALSGFFCMTFWFTSFRTRVRFLYLSQGDSAANPPLAYSEFPPTSSPHSPQFMQGRDSKWSLPIYCPQTINDLKYLYCVVLQLSLFQSQSVLSLFVWKHFQIFPIDLLQELYVLLSPFAAGRTRGACNLWDADAPPYYPNILHSVISKNQLKSPSWYNEVSTAFPMSIILNF